MTDEELAALPDDRVMKMMARHLGARGEYPIGSVLWARAVLAYEQCRREMDRRMIEHVVEAARKRDAEGRGDGRPVT